jgi:hypothetical protein
VIHAARFGVILKPEDAMKRKVDPVEEGLRAERQKAEAWLRILCKGVGSCLMECSGGYPEELQAVLDVVDNYLRAAIAEEERCQEAYKPYWRRRRVRYISKAKAKKAKAA